MRWFFAILAIAALLGAFAILTGPARGVAPAPQAPQAPGGPGRGGPDLTTAPRGAEARLREALANAEPVRESGEFESYLADAQAWVRSNRPPDRPYNDLESRTLALNAMAADGRFRSGLWAMDSADLDVEAVRVIDLDGDGLVSDAELGSFAADRLAYGSDARHPYLTRLYDLDGNGEVDEEEEEERLRRTFEGSLGGLAERGRLNAWDTDNDGFLSEAEHTAGEAAERERLAAEYPEEAAAIEDPISTPEETAAVEASWEYLTRRRLAGRLLGATLLVDGRPEIPRALAALQPRPPVDADFDTDGDGWLSDGERRSLSLASAEYERERSLWGAEFMAQLRKAEFEHATSQHDRDGDGRLTPAEWDIRLEDLLAQREQRLVLMNYDLDGSGRLEAGDLDRFLSWFRRESPRADADLDGRVDARDLELVIRAFEGQRD